MLKKLVFGLVKNGWIKTEKKGVYVCAAPVESISGLFLPRVESVLKEADLSYCFTRASAAEIWSDEVFIQRSWEYSPFFIKVLRKDLAKWKHFLSLNKINFFVETSSNAVGEIVVLFPVSSMKIVVHNEKPVESLEETIGFCEANKGFFEYVLAYLQNKHGKKTSASKELIVKAREAV